MTEPPAVFAAIVAVNKAIAAQGIAKGDRNAQQDFAFRGVDRVYEAMAGPMAEQGLISVPKVLSMEHEARQFRNSSGTVVYLLVEYTFYCATDGSSVTVGPVAAEAMDSGDKATAKAMSVAHRTALLQLSTAPVNPTEPDADTYEVAPPETFAPKADHDATRALMSQVPVERREEVKEWKKANGLTGWPLYKAQLEALTAYVTNLLEEPFTPPPPQVETLPLGDGAPV